MSKTLAYAILYCALNPHVAQKVCEEGARLVIEMLLYRTRAQ